MNISNQIALLTHHAEVIKALASGVSDEQARWKPTPESWSILEVVNHLYDEEREDFRTRFKHLLDPSLGTAPGIDPQGWVTARRYNERDLAPSLETWVKEREASLDWLRGLTDPNLDLFIEGNWGRLSAGDMLAAWVAHDLLHIRQLNELHYFYWQQAAQPYQVGYAGDW